MPILLRVIVALLLAPGLLRVASADSQEEELKRLTETVESLQKIVGEQKKRIENLEKSRRQALPPQSTESPAVAGGAERTSPVTHRPAFADQQEPAPRPYDLTLEPEYRGFIPIPNTGGIMLRFSARPRVDFTYDPKNTGDDNRFIPAKIPVSGDPDSGGRPIANVNTKGTRLNVDVRGPRYAGSPRFFFQNDFFGPGSGEMNFRVRHIYGKIYNVIAGETFGVLEDPDIWPDTVDYKGPNSMVLARIPLLHYQLRLGRQWLATLGIEQPDSSPDGTDVVGVNHAPDGGFNLRWEKADAGHAQLAAVFRDIGAHSPAFGDHSALGWGTNLSGTLDVFGGDTILGQVTCGQGIGSLGNDTSTFDTDAAFDEHGDLVTLPYLAAFAGYTHKWAEDWRSTATYGFVNLEPEASQGPDAYRRTHYASVNLVWQLRTHLGIGVEALYGHKETQNHATGDVARTQVGMVYSIF
jgi:hypothetical protein